MVNDTPYAHALKIIAQDGRRIQKLTEAIPRDNDMKVGGPVSNKKGWDALYSLTESL